ncbi:MAG: DNRLRE domain-containing protein [Saprospiraceae bacterium]|nr:DNRLRE domain-containing protein [Saprospiraceae bacterium]
MRCLHAVCFCLIFSATVHSQTASLTTGSVEQVNDSAVEKQCPNIVFVESPWRDTYTSIVKDSSTFGGETTLKVRGTPAKKSMQALVSFYLPKVDANHIEKSYLNVYTVSKRNEGSLLLYAISGRIDEDTTNWHNQPQSEHLIASRQVNEGGSVQFEITEYLTKSLHAEVLRFCIKSDGKKPVEIASRESGFGAELILDLCPPVDHERLDQSQIKSKDEYSFKVFPCPTSGKFTIELIGLPEGGFGECMLMNEAGAIVGKYPVAIRDGDILYHSLDLGVLIPGNYFAVFRKGRIVLRDQFRLVPSKTNAQVLEVALN